MMLQNGKSKVLFIFASFLCVLKSVIRLGSNRGQDKHGDLARWLALADYIFKPHFTPHIKKNLFPFSIGYRVSFKIMTRTKFVL